MGESNERSTQEWDTLPVSSLTVQTEQRRLLNLINRQAPGDTQERPTRKLRKEGHAPEPDSQPAYSESAPYYLAMPVRLPSPDVDLSMRRWRIELFIRATQEALLGLDIFADAVLGRGAGGKDAPDINLDPYLAYELGVSRRHALLQPGTDYLHLIDAGSTNGTWCGGNLVPPGQPTVIHNNEIIALGNLTLQIRLIDHW